VSTELETTTRVGKGVVLECVQEGTRLRMHVVTKGYHRDWYVQLPRDIREAGARYVVDEVHEATRGGFYPASGTLKSLVPTGSRRKRARLGKDPTHEHCGENLPRTVRARRLAQVLRGDTGRQEDDDPLRAHRRPGPFVDEDVRLTDRGEGGGG